MWGLMQTVKGYAAHEQRVFTQVTETIVADFDNQRSADVNPS